MIHAGLERAGRRLPVLRMVELLDPSIRGTLKEALFPNGAARGN